jgi:hypothetical protein
MLISTKERLELVKLGFLCELEDLLQEKTALSFNPGWVGRAGQAVGQSARNAAGSLARGARNVLKVPEMGGAATGAAIGTAIAPGVGTAIGAGIGGMGGAVGRFLGRGRSAEALLPKAMELMRTGQYKSLDDAMAAVQKVMPPMGTLERVGKGTGALGLGALGLGGYGAYQVGQAGLNTAQDVLTGGDSGAPGRSWLETALRGGLGGAAGYYGMKWLGPQLGLPPEVMQYAPWLTGALGAFGAQG